MKTNSDRASGTMDQAPLADRAPDLLGHRLDAHLPGHLHPAGDPAGRSGCRRTAQARASTTSRATPVAHTVSTLMVRPRNWRWMWSPTEMSVARIGTVRPLPRRRRARQPAGRWHRDGGHGRQLQHRPGDIGQQQQLEERHPTDHPEAERRLDEEQAQGHHGDDGHPAQGVQGQRTALVLVGPLADVDHRALDEPEVGHADAQPGAEAQRGPRLAEEQAAPGARRRRPPGRRASVRRETPATSGREKRSNISGLRAPVRGTCASGPRPGAPPRRCRRPGRPG